MIPRRIPLFSLVAAVVGPILSLAIVVTPAYADCASDGTACQFPAPPTGVKGTASSLSAVHIVWDDYPQAYEYRIQYGKQSDFSDAASTTKAADHSASTQGLDIRGLATGTVYYFRISVIDTSLVQQSPWSATAPYRTKSVFKLSVASYNVHDPDQTGLQGWTWDTRGPKVAGAIAANAPHVAGVQELYDDQDRRDFLTYLSHATTGPYPGGAYEFANPGGDDDGKDARIIYKPSALRLLTHGVVKYSSQARKTDGSIETSRYLTWAKFNDIASGKYLLFATTHLSPRSDSVDVAQWNQLIATINSLRSHSSVALNVIITGDFNVTKFESPASTQLSKMRSYGYEDVLGQIYRSYSTYRNPSTRYESWICSSNQGLRDVRQPNCTVSSGRNSNSIDYIFVSKALKATYYRVYAQPRTGYVMNYLASDHDLVRATVSE